MRSLPPLNALQTFEAAARHLSFQQAAEELDVTSTAISHQIKVLEDYLGVLLFRRRPRPLALTEAGQLLYPTVSASLDAIAFKFNDSCLMGSLVALNFLEILRFLGLKASAWEIDGLIEIFTLLSCSSFSLFVIRNLGGDLARLETTEHYRGLNRNDKKIFVLICLSACLAPILRKDLVGMGIIFMMGNAEKINQSGLSVYSDYLIREIVKSPEENWLF